MEKQNNFKVTEDNWNIALSRVSYGVSIVRMIYFPELIQHNIS